MNKKLFLGMFAAAGMLFATSCSNEEMDVVQPGADTQVTFSLGLENGIATRAISDGTGANVLMYAVFDKDGNRINTIQKVSKTGVTFPTTENITLAKGQTYKVAFWAQDNDCQAYTVSDDMKVTVDYKTNNTTNNDETRDAFFKTVEFTVTGSTSIDVELKRPFAQVNVGVTKEDWNAAVASGITIAQSSVVIKNAATSLNLLDGTVSGETEVSYSLADIPSDPATLKVDTNGDGTDEEYQWLSMSYILPAESTTGYDKTTLENIAFVFAPTAGESIEFKQGLNSVPVQRNWRTNIVGKILTGDITFNIVIDEEFEDDHNVELPYATIGNVAYKSFAEAMAAVQDGETIKLEGETTLNGVKNVKLFTVDKAITIDLNGYGFVANMPDVTENSAIFEVVTGGELTIIGDGNVKFVTKGAPSNVVAFIYNIGGTVNLKGGNWTLSEIGSYALIPTFVDNNSNVNSVTLNIYDGTYTFNRNLFRNFANAASHNNFATVATINIYGGTFNGRESDAGAIWNQKPSSTVPDGAGVINVEGGTFNNVVIDDDFASVDYITVTTADELTQAIVNATTDVTIFLGADITGNAVALQKADVNVVVNGNGHKYDGTIAIHGQGRDTAAETLTLTNIKFETESTNAMDFISAPQKVDGKFNYAHNVTVKGCSFTANTTADIVATRFYQSFNCSIEDCTASGLHSMMWATGGNAVTIDGITMTGCKYGVHFGTMAGHSIKNSTIVTTGEYGYGVRGDAHTKEPGSIVIENCNFTAKAPVLIRKSVANSTYTLTMTGNNTLNTTGDYQIIPTSTDFDEKSTLAPAAGTVNITGGDDFIVYGDVVIADAATIAALLTPDANGVIEVKGDYTITGGTWNPDKFSGNITINGNGHTIKGLNNPLVAASVATDGTALGKLTIKDLTIADAVININGDNAGAFISHMYNLTDQSVSFNNCHLVGSTVKSNNYAAGLIGYTSVDDDKISITGCSIEGCTITGGGSTGGFIGHSASEVEIKNSQVKTSTIECTENRGGDAAKAGAVIGTIQGATTLSNVTVDDATTVTNNNAADPVSKKIGRNVGGSLNEN